MGAVWMRARAELRARWRAWLALALLTGVFAGGVMALAAGARRTQSAYPRFLETTNAADLWVPNLPFGPIWAQFDFDELERHPLVAESARARLAFGELDGSEIGLIGSDPALWRSLNAARMLEGRLPREGKPNEVSLPFPMAQDLRLSVGQQVTWPFSATDNSTVDVTLDVVGIHASAGDFPPVGDTLNAVGTRAFFERYGGSVFGFDVLILRLTKGPAGVPEFSSILGDLGGGKILFTISIAEQTRDVQGSIGLQVTALWLLALVAGVSVALVLGQSIARQSFLDADDDPTLRALGMSGAELFGVALARGALVALSSVAVAVAVAIALSPLTPRGSARIAEPHPGVAFDATVIGVGAAALLVLVVSITVSAGLRRVRLRVVEERARPSVIARAFGRARPAAVAGVRFALEPGRGSSAVPVRTTVMSVATGMATLIGALVFAGNVDRLLATPRLYGEVWDHGFAVAQTMEEDFPDATPIAQDMRARDDLQALAVGSQGVPIELDSVATNGIAMDQLKGAIGPPILEGRAPAHDREIVVGPSTLGRIGKDVGDTVTISIQGTSGIEVAIVGVGVIPPLGVNARFGEGAFLTYELLNATAVKNPQLRGIVPPPDEVYVVYAAGVDQEAVEADIRASYGAGSRRGLETTLGPDFPGIDAADIVSFGRVRAMPYVLAGMLATLALATLIHALVSSVRRRRRDLAVLRTLGFVRRQVRATVRWQSAALAIVTFALALPAGAALGRWGWLLFARSSGVVGEVVVPRHVLLVAPAALLLALLSAALPARAAARTKPALVLRSE